MTVVVDIKAADIQTLYVPQYEGLSTKDILAKASECPEVADYLPDERDHKRMTRQWFINVIFTVMKEPFRQWVLDQIKTRNSELGSKRNLMIEMDPEIAQAFQNSVNISSKSSLPYPAVVKLRG